MNKTLYTQRTQNFDKTLTILKIKDLLFYSEIKFLIYPILEPFFIFQISYLLSKIWDWRASSIGVHALHDGKSKFNTWHLMDTQLISTDRSIP